MPKSHKAYSTDIFVLVHSLVPYSFEYAKLKEFLEDYIVDILNTLIQKDPQCPTWKH